MLLFSRTRKKDVSFIGTLHAITKFTIICEHPLIKFTDDIDLFSYVSLNDNVHKAHNL